MDCLGLKQHVTRPTRKWGHALGAPCDLCLSNQNGSSGNNFVLSFITKDNSLSEFERDLLSSQVLYEPEGSVDGLVTTQNGGV